MKRFATTRTVAFPSVSNRVSTYNEFKSAHVIGNPVPTPEEMAQILGLSSERVAAVRRIMSAPTKRKSSKGANRPAAALFESKSGRSGTASRVRRKR
jgi:3-polyprenyl-4-hydroxybenzoate decarboxylase